MRDRLGEVVNVSKCTVSRIAAESMITPTKSGKSGPDGLQSQNLDHFNEMLFGDIFIHFTEEKNTTLY